MYISQLIKGSKEKFKKKKKKKKTSPCCLSPIDLSTCFQGL